MNNPYTTLAQEALADYFNGKSLDARSNTDKALANKSACFVSLHRRSTGELRGCIGTILPEFPTLAEEIIHNVIAAATSDDRFRPISKEELSDLEISVDVLSRPERVGQTALDPAIFGIIIKASGGRTGVLLPNLDGIAKASDQIAIASQKAGILSTDTYEIYRFKTERFI